VSSYSHSSASYVHDAEPGKQTTGPSSTAKNKNKFYGFAPLLQQVIVRQGGAGKIPAGLTERAAY
jgi:hypothetical protein